MSREYIIYNIKIMKKKENLIKVDWNISRFHSVEVQRNFFIVMILSLFIFLLFGSMLILYASQAKIIEPFVVEIDKKNISPKVIKPIKLKTYRADSAIIEYFLYKYINARESYSFYSYKFNYGQVVRIMSVSNIYTSFIAKEGKKNQRSFVNKYRDKYKVEVIISDIRKIDNYKEIELLKKHINLRTEEITKKETKKILIKYKFLPNLLLSEEDKLINPLGFVVSEYYVIK